MLPVIARWTMKAGKEVEAIAALKLLVAEVYEKSPFVTYYSVHRNNDTVESYPSNSPREIIFYSIFEDEAAFQKHLTGTTFNNWLEAHRALFLQKNGDVFVVSQFMTIVDRFSRLEAR